MYNEALLNGKPYKKGDWKTIAVHNDKEIKGFFGDFRFLSNFWSSPILFEGIEYKNSEAAYQAQKVKKPFRGLFSKMTAEESKKNWKKYPRMDGGAASWDRVKADIMYEITLAKYSQNKELCQKLLDTGSKYLEEKNWWGDVFFGVDAEKGGENILGKILMRVRTELAAHKNHAFHEKDYSCPSDDFKYGYGRQND